MVFCVYLLFWGCWDGSIWMADKEQTGCTWCYLYMLYTYYYYFCFSASFFINNKTQNETNALGSNWRHLHWLVASGGPGKQNNQTPSRTNLQLPLSSSLPSTSPKKHSPDNTLVGLVWVFIYFVCLSLITHSIFCLAIRNFLLYAVPVVSVSCQVGERSLFALTWALMQTSNTRTDFNWIIQTSLLDVCFPLL